MKGVRRAGVHRLPHCKNVLIRVGIFPIRDHYYEPQFNYSKLDKPLSQDRFLPGIQWNTDEQLATLAKFVYACELANIPDERPTPLAFYFNNGAFAPGDAEYWYQLVRAIKPARIIEIGSGNSTLMALRAIQKNTERDRSYNCQFICVEPYEMPWLEETGVSVLRKKVEDVDLSIFHALEESDILFIDSSHIIRPQGDVLYEILELLPTLRKGVIVHFHDIFSPKNYLRSWVQDEVIFWNEQYLLEAFLSNNTSWKIIGALNYLHHQFYERLSSVAPYLTPPCEPGSFYIQKCK